MPESQASYSAQGGNPGDVNVAAQEQTDEEKASIHLVEKLLAEAKRARQAHDDKWMDYYRFFRGKQWKEKRPSYRHSEVLNYIFSEIQNVLVLMTDNRPRIEVLPEDPTDQEFSDILSEVLIAKWDAYQWASVVAESIIDAAIYGTAIGSVPWKQDLLDGIGDFAFETEDPFHCYPDPSAKSKINDEYCQYFITAVPTDIGLVKKMYPEKADLIKPDLSELAAASHDPFDQEEMRLKSPIDNRVLIETFRPNQAGKPNQVLLVNCYLKSYEKIEEVVSCDVDAETGLETKQYQERYKYPNGRRIVMANQICLSDPTIDEKTGQPKDSNPYINGRVPHAKLVDYIMPREFWGMGEVEQMKSPQEIINKTISYAMDVLILMGNPIWVVDTESNVETQNLTNQPGLVVEKTKGSEVRRETGVGLQPHVLEIFNLMTERVMSKLGSTSDVSKGISPSPNASGFAIEQLQEAAQTRIRGKSRNLEQFLKDVGELMIDRILQFYTVPRIVRLTNNENVTKYFKFHITDVADEEGEIVKRITVQNFEPDENDDLQEQAPRDLDLKSKLDIRVNVGSSLGFAKQKRETTAKELFQLGILTPEELLEEIEYPNRAKIIQRIKSQPPAPPEGQAPQGAPNAQ